MLFRGQISQSTKGCPNHSARLAWLDPLDVARQVEQLAIVHSQRIGQRPEHVGVRACDPSGLNLRQVSVVNSSPSA